MPTTFAKEQFRWDTATPEDLKPAPTDLERAEWDKQERRFYQSFENLYLLQNFVKEFVGGEREQRINKLLADLEAETDAIDADMGQYRQGYFES